MFKTNLSRSGFISIGLITTFCLLGILSMPVAAHPTQNSDPTISQQQVSASQARRITRSFLSNKGYSQNIGPGSAHIDGVTREGDHWLINVTLRNSSAAGGPRHRFYINSFSGQLSETKPSQLLVGDTVKPAGTNPHDSP